MENQTLAIVLFSFVLAIPLSQSMIGGPKEVDQWFQNLKHAKDKTSRFHFYYHDTTMGKNPSSATVAKAPTTDKSPTQYGVINMCDDPLTTGPDPSSPMVGRAQGLYGSASHDEFGLLMVMNLVFTAGKFNGSTLTLLGRNPTAHRYREMPIIGGSGVFRLARGIATAQTYMFDVPGGHAIIEYNVVAMHY